MSNTPPPPYYSYYTVLVTTSTIANPYLTVGQFIYIDSKTTLNKNTHTGLYRQYIRSTNAPNNYVVGPNGNILYVDANNSPSGVVPSTNISMNIFYYASSDDWSIDKRTTLTVITTTNPYVTTIPPYVPTQSVTTTPYVPTQSVTTNSYVSPSPTTFVTPTTTPSSTTLNTLPFSITTTPYINTTPTPTLLSLSDLEFYYCEKNKYNMLQCYNYNYIE